MTRTKAQLTVSRRKEFHRVARRSKSILRIVDSHTAGEGTRLLLDTLRSIRGKSMLERKKFFQKNFDYLRTTLTQEPRYFPGVVAFLIPPTDPKAHYGVIFADYRGYVDMCVHGTIGIATSLHELSGKSKNPVLFDTPAGLVRARLNLAQGRMRSVSVTNVPSMSIGRVTLEDDLIGKIVAEIAFGGNTYAYVNASDIGMEVIPKNLAKLLAFGRRALSKLRRSNYNPVLGVSLFEDLGRRKARNIMIADNGLWDRSPCGTGTCGRMAILYEQGKLQVDQEFVNRSIIGSEFTGKIIGRTRIGKHQAIEPEITGTAYLTGTANIIVSNDDKLGKGFIVNELPEVRHRNA